MKSIGGIKINDTSTGWAKTQVTTQSTGAKTIVYQGDTDNLSSALGYIKSVETYDDLTIASDPNTGTSTVTLNVTAVTANAEVATEIPEEETRMPTCSISGSMASPSLHQHPSFSPAEGDKLNILAMQVLEYLLKNKGFISMGDLKTFNSVEMLYAQWRVYGMDTYLAPTYTMTKTHSFEATKNGRTKAQGVILQSGKVFKFETVISSLPKAVQPIDIGVPAWLANAPSIAYDENGITVTQTFTGATAFPNFYDKEDESLVYAPPTIPEINYNDNITDIGSSGNSSSGSGTTGEETGENGDATTEEV